MAPAETRYHTRANHEYHLQRFKRCIYCINGCKIQPETEEMIR